jgi:hypothetical protein
LHFVDFHAPTFLQHLEKVLKKVDVADPWLQQMPPFQSEGQEKKCIFDRRPCQSSSSSRVPFGDEGDEGPPQSSKRLKTQGRAKQRKPFGEEESDCTFAGSESDEFVPKSELTSTFALGWQTLENFTKATGWSKHVKDEEARQKAAGKRAYNNTNRAAAADKNVNRRSTQVFATRGADPERISKLLARKCDCASVPFVAAMAQSFSEKQPANNVFATCCFRCQQNVLQPVSEAGGADSSEEVLGLIQA